jgi:hypothetical protein
MTGHQGATRNRRDERGAFTAGHPDKIEFRQLRSKRRDCGHSAEDS